LGFYDPLISEADLVGVGFLIDEMWHPVRIARVDSGREVSDLDIGELDQKILCHQFHLIGEGAHIAWESTSGNPIRELHPRHYDLIGGDSSVAKVIINDGVPVSRIRQRHK
jgi:hypothetical protein